MQKDDPGDDSVFGTKTDFACRTPASFTEDIRRSIMNKTGNCKRRKDGFMAMAAVLLWNQLLSPPMPNFL